MVRDLGMASRIQRSAFWAEAVKLTC